MNDLHIRRVEAHALATGDWASIERVWRYRERRGLMDHAALDGLWLWLSRGPLSSLLVFWAVDISTIMWHAAHCALPWLHGLVAIAWPYSDDLRDWDREMQDYAQGRPFGFSVRSFETLWSWLERQCMELVARMHPDLGDSIFVDRLRDEWRPTDEILSDLQSRIEYPGGDA